MAIKVLATGFYAQQGMKTPVKIGIVAMVSNMIWNIIFVLILHYNWHLGHVIHWQHPCPHGSMHYYYSICLDRVIQKMYQEYLIHF